MDRLVDFSEVRSCEKAITVWGLGYIGVTTTSAFLAAGYRVIGIDPDIDRIRQITEEEVELNAVYATKVDLRDHLQDGSFVTYLSPFDLEPSEVGCHILCLPTERNGEPDPGPLVDVLRFVSAATPESPVIIESTVSPGWVTTMELDSKPVALAPRRDWFHSPDHSLESLTRVCAASTPRVETFARTLLSSISGSVVWSSDLLAVATVKAFENSIWFVLFSYINELASHMSGVNFDEVLRLAETNWRTPFHFEPSFHVGGYCLPLSAAYLQQIAEISSTSSSAVLQGASRANARSIEATLERIVEPSVEIESVLILGVAYRPGIKVSTNSPGSILARMCVDAGLAVFLHDPLYSDDELRSSLNGVPISLEVGLHEAHCVVACTPHDHYLNPWMRAALVASPSLRRLVDSIGIFPNTASADLPFDYALLGSTSW